MDYDINLWVWCNRCYMNWLYFCSIISRSAWNAQYWCVRKILTTTHKFKYTRWLPFLWEQDVIWNGVSVPRKTGWNWTKAADQVSNMRHSWWIKYSWRIGKNVNENVKLAHAKHLWDIQMLQFTHFKSAIFFHHQFEKALSRKS